MAGATATPAASQAQAPPLLTLHVCSARRRANVVVRAPKAASTQSRAFILTNDVPNGVAIPDDGSWSKIVKRTCAAVLHLVQGYESATGQPASTLCLKLDHPASLDILTTVFPKLLRTRPTEFAEWASVCEVRLQTLPFPLTAN